MDAWNPAQYERFKAERRQPFEDLCTLIERRPEMDVVDLGSGTGELTRALHERLGARSTLGVERSAAMRAKSDAYVTSGLCFEASRIEDYAAARTVDLVFSNAALQWVPDHRALFTRLARALRPKGQLAVQMPANYDHPSHTVAAAVAREEPFRKALGGFTVEPPVLAAEQYAALLNQLGFQRQHVRCQVYGHPLERGSDVVEWVRGTLLTAYMERMPEDAHESFLARYREALAAHVSPGTPFFFTFKRLLLWAAY